MASLLVSAGKITLTRSYGSRLCLRHPISLSWQADLMHLMDITEGLVAHLAELGRVCLQFEGLENSSIICACCLDHTWIVWLCHRRTLLHWTYLFFFHICLKGRVTVGEWKGVQKRDLYLPVHSPNTCNSQY